MTDANPAPGPGLVLVGAWSVSGPADQRRIADAALDAWRTGPWPGGLLAYDCLLGEDERTVVHCSEWTDEAAARAFAGAGKSAWLHAVHDAVPDIVHQKVTAYRRYRSTTPLPAPPPAGCVVTVTVDLEEPDPERQRAWVDNAFDAAGTADPAPEAGLLSARFHLSLDGARVLNLAGWTTAQAHRDAAGVTDGFRERVRGFPGATSVTRRHLPYGHLAA